MAFLVVVVDCLSFWSKYSGDVLLTVFLVLNCFAFIHMGTTFTFKCYYPKRFANEVKVEWHAVGKNTSNTKGHGISSQGMHRLIKSYKCNDLLITFGNLFQIRPVVWKLSIDLKYNVLCLLFFFFVTVTFHNVYKKGLFPVKPCVLPVLVGVCFFFLLSIQPEEEMWEQTVLAADKTAWNFPPFTRGICPFHGTCCQGSLQKQEHPSCLPTTCLRNLILSDVFYFVL